ncbi:hypothetical protein OH492_26700 [Vibrio chagasii]|nr:hypothetical protein [Vibrio chagasii]
MVGVWSCRMAKTINFHNTANTQHDFSISRNGFYAIYRCCGTASVGNQGLHRRFYAGEAPAGETAQCWSP